MAGELNKLSDRKLKGLHGIPASKIEFYADGAGLSAKVTKAGGISWVFTYRLDGQKLHRLTLGRYPDMSLKEARSSRDKCRQWLASGKDPKHQLALTTQETLKPVTVQEASCANTFTLILGKWRSLTAKPVTGLTALTG